MLADLLCYAEVKPVCNEIELNPTLAQFDLCKFMKSVEIVPIAYTPVSRLGERDNSQYDGEEFMSLCTKYGKT